MIYTAANQISEFFAATVKIAHLFVPPQRKFIFHRIFGFCYLTQWFTSLVLFFTAYDYYASSPLTWTMPLNGLIQSITATYYFTFLPKNQEDGGFNSDKSVLSYKFVKENIFFAGLLLFQCLYYYDPSYRVIKELLPVELFLVFLPYILRQLFPKTSFRVAINTTSNKSKRNFRFFVITSWITKIFYVLAKHFIGFFFNYARFAERVQPDDHYWMHFLLIFGGFATTISMFLHTLKFKKYIGPRTAYLVYIASYAPMVFAILSLHGLMLRCLDLVTFTLIGVVLNFYPSIYVHQGYQAMVMAIMYAMRSGMLPVKLF